MMGSRRCASRAISPTSRTRTGVARDDPPNFSTFIREIHYQLRALSFELHVQIDAARFERQAASHSQWPESGAQCWTLQVRRVRLQADRGRRSWEAVS